MRETTSFLLKKYKAMSGDKKIRITFSLSKLVQLIYKEGRLKTQQYGNRSI